MTSAIDLVKKKFREGQRDAAIAQCEALCLQHPDDPALRRLCGSMHALTRGYARALELLRPLRDAAHEDADLLFNLGACERGLKNHAAAHAYFTVYTEKFAQHLDGWLSLAECSMQLQRFEEGLRQAGTVVAREEAVPLAHSIRGHCHKGLGQLEEALASFQRAAELEPGAEAHFHVAEALRELGRPLEAVASLDAAIALAPKLARLRTARGDIWLGLGRLAQAAADYQLALSLAPSDEETLKKATRCLLESDQGAAAIALCREALDANPDNLTAKLGAEWVTSRLVPMWHVPMMNEAERNQAFHDGLARTVTPDSLVFEVGSGSGLIAMMAARLGAQQVIGCEAVGLIADTAQTIIAANGLADRVKVLAKPSFAVQLGEDLPQQADLLVHEIFSSELLGEHVLPAIEDARARLLKPGGRVLPRAASLMIALVGGDALGRYLHVGESFGFDLRAFNTIYPKRRPMFREDVAPVFMSVDLEAFRFDFQGQATFPPQQKQLSIEATQGGLCWGVIQWLRIEVAEGVVFENHPAQRRVVSNWQHTVHGFDAPLDLRPGQRVAIHAVHDRARPWFELHQADV